MSDTTVTMGPTLVNPEALDTVAELRTALHQANVQAMVMGEQMHRDACMLDHLKSELSSLLVKHIEQDPVGVYELLDGMAKKYVRPMARASATVY